MSIPATHLAEAQKLDADSICHLYTLTLKGSGGVFRFWNNPEVTWQGHLYNYWPCVQDKDAVTTDNENPRPNLTVINPEGILTSMASEGLFDLALVTRKDVLTTHLYANQNIYAQRVWFVGKVSSATRQQITFELRSAIDHPNFDIPPRQFVPPEFPFLVY